MNCNFETDFFNLQIPHELEPEQEPKQKNSFLTQFFFSSVPQNSALNSLNRREIIPSESGPATSKVLVDFRNLLLRANNPSKMLLIAFEFMKVFYDVFDQKYRLEKLRENIERASFCNELRKRVSEIRAQVEQHRDLAYLAHKVEEVSTILKSAASSYSTVEGSFKIDPTRLQPIENGISGSYFLLGDDLKTPLAVVKPVDEEAGAINNPKHFFSLSRSNPVRDDMPLYHSALKEAFAYQLAQHLGLLPTTSPPTTVAIIESERFFRLDRSSEFTLGDCGSFPTQKLCSVQKFIPNAKMLFEVTHDVLGSSRHLNVTFNQRSFEELNILIWTLFDTDANPGNILALLTGMDTQGNPRYSLTKIDNGLALPEKNGSLYNSLEFFPNMNQLLSQEGKEQILRADVDVLSQLLREYGLEGSIPAFQERMLLLKEWVQEPDITLSTINRRLKSLDPYETSNQNSFFQTTSEGWYRNKLKSREFEQEMPQSSYSEQETFTEKQFANRSTWSKADSSGRFAIGGSYAQDTLCTSLAYSPAC